MNWFLACAAALTVAIGVAHSWLGEVFIIRRLLRRNDLPELFGDDRFTRQTIRFAWHLTTVAWFGLATVMLLLSGAVVGMRAGDAVVFAIAQTFLLSAFIALVASRGRHLAWIVFAGITALCLLAAS